MKNVAVVVLAWMSWTGLVSANLIQNSSFESPAISNVVYNAGAGWNTGGTLTDWTGQFMAYGQGNHWFAYGNFGPSTAQDGSQCVNMQNYQLWQHTGIQMVEGTTYTLSGYVRYGKTNNGIASLNLYSTTSSTLNLAGNIVFLQAATYSGSEPLPAWTVNPNLTVSYTCTAATAGKYLVANVREYSPYVGGVNKGATLAVDNLTLVPEPAAMGLLAMGGLGLIRRRR